jgi:hypothetical protein
MKEPPTIESVHGSLEDAIDPLTARTLDLLRSQPPPPSQLQQQAPQSAISIISRQDYSPLRGQSPELTPEQIRQSRGTFLDFSVVIQGIL